MPEEINRIMCDHVSTLLFSPTVAGLNNLLNEGFHNDSIPPYTADNPRVYHCGDVMFDNSLHFSKVAEERTSIIADLGLTSDNYILATIHRNNNTDDPARLAAIFSALNRIADEHQLDIVLPLHPRTKKLLSSNLSAELYSKIKTNKRLRLIEPVSFLEMIALEKNTKLVMTDSGGVQKEAFFFAKPCIIFRPETEWVELVNCGAARLADADENEIVNSFSFFGRSGGLQFPMLFGDGKAAEFICREILKHL
jgi:UDP-GlcNAc3NAcA epimerase